MSTLLLLLFKHIKCVNLLIVQEIKIDIVKFNQDCIMKLLLQQCSETCV